MSRNKQFIISFFLTTYILLALCGGVVIYVDPFHHYHAPKEGIEYTITDWNYETYYNDGFVKYFDYDSMVLGTSMGINFKPSMIDEAKGTKTIKVCASGAYLNILDSYLKEAYESGHDLKYVFRPVDCAYLSMKEDEKSKYDKQTEYLRNKNPFDDVKYIFNKDTVVKSADKLIHRGDGIVRYKWDSLFRIKSEGRSEYIMSVYNAPTEEVTQKEPSEEILNFVKDNIQHNILDTVAAHPETQFDMFLTPYSVAWWGQKYSKGEVLQEIENQKITMEQFLEYDNIHLYGFGDIPELVTDLDMYFDDTHYIYSVSETMESMILSDINRITKENYMEYINRITDLYMNYDYITLEGKLPRDNE